MTTEEHDRRVARVARFEALKQAEPDDILIRFGLATEHFALGNWAAAGDEARHAIRIKQDYSAAYLLLGRALYHDGASDEAERVLTEGSTIAEHTGDLMPAREMRATLRRISADRAATE